MTKPNCVPGFDVGANDVPPSKTAPKTGIAMNDSDEVKRLRSEIERLERMLNTAAQTAANDVTNVSSLLKDREFICDFARFSEGVLDEKFLRRKYRFSDDVWTKLGEDEKLIEEIELERNRRIHSGQTKKELAQKHVVAAPGILNGIMCDERISPRHRVDSIKMLDNLTGHTPEAGETDKVYIKIDMGADIRAKGGTPTQADVLTYTVDVTPQELPPPRREPGRQRTEDGDDGNAL